MVLSRPHGAAQPFMAAMPVRSEFFNPALAQQRCLPFSKEGGFLNSGQS